MSEDLGTLVGMLIFGALALFFFGAARVAGKSVPRHRHEQDEGRYAGPWSILESRKRDRNLEGDEIATMDDGHRLDEEDEVREWLDQPSDDSGSGWTNFDYIAAGEMEDEWDVD